MVLRDDKQYPYLRLPVKEDFPRLSIVRKVQKDGALYYGPYVPAGALRQPGLTSEAISGGLDFTSLSGCAGKVADALVETQPA